MTDARFRTKPVTRAVVVLVASAIALFVIGAGLGFTLVGRTGGGVLQGCDEAVWRWSLNHRGPFVGVAKVVGTVGDAATLGIICVTLTAVLVAWLRSLLAVTLLAAYLGAEFEVFAIRQVIHRHRPLTADFPARAAIRGIHETSYSYPSGHAVAVTAVLFAGLGTLALRRRREWPWLLALAISVCVAATRLILGVHWLTDVTIGALIGVAWGATVALVAHATCSAPAACTSPSG
jgi:membrane-associated phospholipid phosphatase